MAHFIALLRLQLYPILSLLLLLNLRRLLPLTKYDTFQSFWIQLYF